MPSGDDNFWWRWTTKMPAPIRAVLGRRFVRFLVVGGVNALFGYGMFALFFLLGAPYPIAALLATVLGVLFNFKSYGAAVFGKHDNRLIFRFIGVYVVCYFLGLVPLEWAERNGHPVLVVAAIAALPMAAISFLLNRAFVFEHRRP